MALVIASFFFFLVLIEAQVVQQTCAVDADCTSRSLARCSSFGVSPDCTLPSIYTLAPSTAPVYWTRGGRCGVRMSDATRSWGTIAFSNGADPSSNKAFTALNMSWYYVYSEDAAEGYSFNWGTNLPVRPDINTAPTQEGIQGTNGNGLSFTVDLRRTSNVANDAVAIGIKFRNNPIVESACSISVSTDSWRRATVSVSSSGSVLFTHERENGQTACTVTYQIPGVWTGISGGSFMFGSREVSGSGKASQWFSSLKYSIGGENYPKGSCSPCAIGGTACDRFAGANVCQIVSGVNTCQDINECDVATPCDAARLARCTESTTDSSILPNARRCTCASGYQVTGRAGGVSSVDLTTGTAFPGCIMIDGCKLYGGEGVPNVKSCVNFVNSRTVTCNDGYFALPPTNPAVTLTGSEAFGGCKLIQTCTQYPPTPNTNLENCTSLVNARRVRCSPGYYASAPSTQTADIAASGPWAGCQDIDECAVYAFSGRSGNVASVRPCTHGVNSRTITCAQGYYAGNTNTWSPSTTLSGSTQFPGCSVIDSCALYETQTTSQLARNNLRSCVASAVNTRTLTCLPGYGLISTPKQDVQVVVGNSPVFPGCRQVDMCVEYGGVKTATNKVSSCVPGLNNRTITCESGYFVSGYPAQTTVTLLGKTTFGGCIQSSPCSLYGYSGKPNGTQSCVNIDDQTRVITCRSGWHVSGSVVSTSNITLSNTQQFPGCLETGLCSIFGPPINSVNKVQNCFQVSENVRRVECQPGYSPYKEGTNAGVNFIDLTGSTPFGTCFEIDECKVYPSSGSNILDCANLINQRRITCNEGFYAVAPNVPSIVLNGSTTFVGCRDIQECSIYRFSGNLKNAASCSEPSPNRRTITCTTGYWAAPPNLRSITLIGNETFNGCFNVDYCTTYGNSTSQGTTTCTNNPDGRTITCSQGFYAVAPTNRTIYIPGNGTFQGCKNIDECAVYGTSGINTWLSSTPCTEYGVNARMITCAAGYFAVAPASRSIILVGNAPFTGCRDIDDCRAYPIWPNAVNTRQCRNNPTPDTRTIICQPYTYTTYPNNQAIIIGNGSFIGCRPRCGDSARITPETCDDGNFEEGDGCDSYCQIEPGYICPILGGACCKLHDELYGHGFYSQLVCRDGVLSPKNASTFSHTISLPSPSTGTVTETVLLDELYICGSFQVSSTLVINATTLYVYGALDVTSEGDIILRDGGRIRVESACNNAYNYESKGDLRVAGSITVENFYWDKETDDIYHTLITVNGKAKVEGTLNFNAVKMPTGSNSFRLISVNGSDIEAISTDAEPGIQTYTLTQDLPGGCSNMEVKTAGSIVEITLNYMDLCTGQIIGIVFGAFFGALVLAGILIALATMGGGGGDDAYTAL